ncbi:MAG: hypothetical protein MUE37_03460 [Bacteroidales bacterium]|jgi:hypothetical protein|nr:hypothetical protein [Bacteroidales bacterium]
MKKIVVISLLNLVFALTFAQRQGIELSHYIFPGFTEGTVLMKSGLLNKASLNYNALSEEMIFEDKGKKLAIGKDEMEKVDTVFIMTRKFFILNDKFVELIYRSGYELYAEYKCDVKFPGKPAAYGGTSETSSVTTYSGVYNNGAFYELKLPDGFTVRPYTMYWLKKDGEVKRFVSLKQLTRLFDDRKDIIREYISTHRPDYDDQESLIELIRYLDEK